MSRLVLILALQWLILFAALHASVVGLQNGQLTLEQVRGPDMGGGVGGMLYSLRPGDVTRYSTSNGRGDVIAQSDPSGGITWSASYEGYGKRTQETGTNLDRQRANTKEEDPTGLLNEGFRYRDLETGTWLSRDPAGFVDGPNLYAYVKQNPWSGFDPDGLAEEKNDKNLTKDQQKKFIEGMRKKASDLYKNHDHQVGEKTPAAKTAKKDGKEIAYCNQYPSECVAAGYEAIGMVETAKTIREKTMKMGQGVMDLTKVLQGRGWTAVFYNTDTGSAGSDGSHQVDTNMVKNSNGKYWAPARTGADGKKKLDWMKVDGSLLDFGPNSSGYTDAGNEDIKKVDFAVIAGSRGRHGAVMSHGGLYDVHRSEIDVSKLYQKSDFNRSSGLLQSGVIVLPPGGHVPSYEPID
jgi:RHS repeat-associated protein